MLSHLTYDTYQRGKSMFDRFRIEVGLQNRWPIPVDDILSFIAYLYELKFSHSTIVCYLSGIGFHCKLNDFDDVTQKFVVKKVLEGVRRCRPQSKDLRLPITFDLLKMILTYLPSICKSDYETRLFRAAFSLSFHGFFRIGEIPANNHGVRHTLLLQNVNFSNSVLSVRLFISKTDQFGRGVTISIDL